MGNGAKSMGNIIHSGCTHRSPVCSCHDRPRLKTET